MRSPPTIKPALSLMFAMPMTISSKPNITPAAGAQPLGACSWVLTDVMLVMG